MISLTSSHAYEPDTLRMVQLSNFDVNVHHFTSVILICLSIALYFICPHVYHEFARISICWFASTYHICPNVYSTMPFLIYKCSCLHKYLYLFTIEYCCNNLLYVPQLYLFLNILNWARHSLMVNSTHQRKYRRFVLGSWKFAVV